MRYQSRYELPISDRFGFPDYYSIFLDGGDFISFVVLLDIRSLDDDLKLPEDLDLFPIFQVNHEMVCLTNLIIKLDVMDDSLIVSSIVLLSCKFLNIIDTDRDLAIWRARVGVIRRP